MWTGRHVKLFLSVLTYIDKNECHFLIIHYFLLPTVDGPRSKEIKEISEFYDYLVDHFQLVSDLDKKTFHLKIKFVIKPLISDILYLIS